jgi:membrane protease YdiL (CAAX protease family)
MSLVGLARRFPLGCYFALAYALSAVALVAIGLPNVGGSHGRSTASFAMFPMMVIGVGVLGVALTRATQGAGGVRELHSRLAWPPRRRWLLVLAIPPIAILAVLGGLEAGASAKFAPGFLVFGLAAGAFAGFFEELGWTGFAYPRMHERFGPLGGALLLGVLWGLWHFPVADSLGAASPHGRYWPEFFGAFVAAIVALRVLIAWVYVNTGSLRMAQLLHASSTGSLVVLGAPDATPGQEALWYLAYGAVLWLIVSVVVALWGRTLWGALRHRERQRQAPMSAPAGS